MSTAKKKFGVTSGISCGILEDTTLYTQSRNGINNLKEILVGVSSTNFHVTSNPFESVYITHTVTAKNW